MPVVARLEVDGGVVVLWEITESEEQLGERVSTSDVESAEGFRGVQRRVEHLAWRAALRSVLPDVDVEYDSVGAPIVKSESSAGVEDAEGACCDNNAPYISASHTKGMAAVMVSDRRCAIDIEHRLRSVSAVADRFISQQERLLPDAEHDLFQVVVWCAKEVLYKLSGQKELDFIDNLKIKAVDLQNNTVWGSVEQQQKEVLSVKINIARHEDYLILFSTIV